MREQHSLVAWLLAAVLWLASFFLYTRHIDFPAGFHFNEPAKVGQIRSDGQRLDFNHPVLLLATTRLAIDVTGLPDDPATVLAVGRRVSAAFAATAATAAAFIGLAMGGPGAMLVAWLFVALCPQLLVPAHYLKEDAALLMGLLLSLAAVFWLERASQPRTRVVLAALLGVGIAAAISAKYIGVLALPVALAALFALVSRARLGPRTGALLAGVLLATTLASTLLFNHWAVQHPDRFSRGLNKEYRHATTEHYGVTMARPNTYLARAVHRQVPGWILALAFAQLLLPWPGKRRIAEWTLAALAVGYFAAISFSALPFTRHAAPVIVLAYLLAALAVIRITRLLASRKPAIPALKWLGPAVPTALLLILAPRALAFTDQFRDDSRYGARDWLAAHVQAGEQVLADRIVFPATLWTRDKPRPDGMQAIAFAVYDMRKPPAQLAAEGIRYVAVTDISWARYFDPSTRGSPGEEADFERKRDWYRMLFEGYRPAWASTVSLPSESYTNPEIRIYDLRAPVTGAMASSPRH